jgi:sulfatase maturation enzyme AslB (radical SAM superfamily)
MKTPPFRPLDMPRFFWQRKILGRRIPLLASFKITYRCNLACRACPFHLRSKHEDTAMSWDTAVGALNALRTIGTRLIVFEGGEPLLWRDGSRHLSDVIRYARGLFLRVAVTTNGTLPLDVPADTLWVSLDGLKETHDDLLINVDPDGTITQGCYVKNRGEIHCEACGFTPVAEASGALDLIPGSLWAGWKLFLKT